MLDMSTNTTQGIVRKRQISSVYFVIISLFIFMANVGTICVVWMKKRKKPTDHLLRTLAILDLATLFCQFPLGMVYSLSGVWKGGTFSCSFVIFMSLFLLRFSMIVSTMIVIDRFLAVSRPFFYRSKVRLRPIIVILVLSGIYCGLIGIFPLLDYNLSNTTNNNKWWLCVYHWKTSQSNRLTRFHIIAHLIDSTLCVLVGTGCNVAVVMYFLKRRKKTQSSGKVAADGESCHDNTSRRGKDIKYAKLMSLITLYLPLAIIPTQILVLLQHFKLISIDSATASLYQMHVTALCLLCNPICYTLIRTHYRRAFVFIVRHPTVLCGGFPTKGVFDFDTADRILNFPRMAFVTLAAARFRQNISSRSKFVPNREIKDDRGAKGIPSIVEDIQSSNIQVKSKDIVNRSSSFLQPSPSVSGYFSDLESLPPSPTWLLTPSDFQSRSRVESCGSEVTEFISDLSPKVSFQFDSSEGLISNTNEQKLGNDVFQVETKSFELDVLTQHPYQHDDQSQSAAHESLGSTNHCSSEHKALISVPNEISNLETSTIDRPFEDSSPSAQISQETSNQMQDISVDREIAQCNLRHVEGCNRLPSISSGVKGRTNSKRLRRRRAVGDFPVS